MELTINKADKTKEYVWFTVLADCNLSNFAVLDKTYSKGGNVSNLHKHVYRFPDKKVVKDQIVFLYTRTGSYSFVGDNPSFPKGIHHFYMNLDISIWNNDETDCVALWKIEDSEEKKAV